MARPKNPENIYALTCVVTGVTINTNPKQVDALTKRYNCSKDELRNGYVSQQGRNKLRADGENVETATAKYNIPSNIALQLSVLRPKPVRVPKTQTENTPETPTPVVSDSVEGEDTATAETSTPIVTEEVLG